MAQRAIEMGLLVAFAIMMVLSRSSAQPLGGCTPVLSSLSPCIGYIVGNSSAPTTTCCTQLAGLVQTQAQCLCAILGGGFGPLGFIANQTQALMLPGACKLRMSTATSCGFSVSSPAGAPAAAPTSAAPPATVSAPATSRSVPVESTPPVSSPSSPSGGGSTKTTTEASTARSSTKFAPALFFFSLLIVASSYA